MNSTYKKSITETLWAEVKKYHGTKRARSCVDARIKKLAKYAAISRNYPTSK